MITFTDNLLREPKAPEHIAVNESWDKMDSQAITLAEVALMLMTTINFVLRITFQHLLFYAIVWETKPNFVYSIQNVYYDLPFLPQFATYMQCTCNVFDSHMDRSSSEYMYFILNWWINCCGNKYLILIVQTRTYRFLTLWFVHFHPEDSVQ